MVSIVISKLYALDYYPHMSVEILTNDTFYLYFHNALSHTNSSFFLKFFSIFLIEFIYFIILFGFYNAL